VHECRETSNALHALVLCEHTSKCVQSYPANRSIS